MTKAGIQKFLEVEVKDVRVDQLKTNKYNSMMFEVENESYFEELEADIKKRGILQPLIAKKDHTLIAGHNRLLIAKNLKMKTVPVLFVKRTLTDEEELQIVVGENTKRRHLTREKRRDIYARMVSEFEKRAVIPVARGRKPTNSKKSTIALDPKEISTITGIPEKIVKQDLRYIRQEEKSMKKMFEILPPSDVSLSKVRTKLRGIVAEGSMCNKKTARSIIGMMASATKEIKKAHRI